MIATATVLAWGTLQPVFVHAETRVIPGVVLSERYDSNVFRAPLNLLPPGQRADDFISSVGGGGQVLYKSRDVDASLTGGAEYNKFAYHNELSYIATRSESYARLDGWVGRFAEGARLLISERFRYTPEPPAFITGIETPVGDDPFAEGIQGTRAKSYSGSVKAAGSYPVFKQLALKGDYSYSLRRKGKSVGFIDTTPGTTYSDTNVHRWSVGPSLSLTSEDNISLLYAQNIVNQTVTGTGQTSGYNAHEAYAEYSRLMQGWSVTFRGGMTYLEPAGLAFPTGGVKFSTNPERPTYVQLNLSRQISPVFFIESGASISNVVQALIIHRLSNRLELHGSVNYNYRETVPDRTAKFENLLGTIELNYMLTRVMEVNLSYRHTNVTIEQPGIPYEMFRNVVWIRLTAKWE